MEGFSLHKLSEGFATWNKKNSTEKFFFILGSLFLLLGIIGLLLPVVPQVPFAILAAYFYSKSSPKIHTWIRQHPVMGKAVINWEDHRVITIRMKIISTLMMIGGALFSHWQISGRMPWVIDGIFLLSIGFIWFQRSAPPRA